MFSLSPAQSGTSNHGWENLIGGAHGPRKLLPNKVPRHFRLGFQPSRRKNHLMWPYAVATFTGAFLLFELEPLVGKYVLPWFGGAPSVWTTCLMFFQLSLLAGYAYTHVLSKLAPRHQAIFHSFLLCGTLAFLPIIPSTAWKSHTDGDPTFRILVMLVATWGVPYFLLSATSPLLQHWLVRTEPNASPYRLYALSNTGSLLALLSYPFAVEPNLARNTQAQLWGWGLAAYVLFCFWCMAGLWRQKPRPDPAHHKKAQTIVRPPALPDRLLWLLLPSAASLLLSATTNRMCQDVAPIPFLWVMPLAAYLLSFIICFDHPRWYSRQLFTLAFVVSTCAVCWVMFNATEIGIWVQLAIYLTSLFFTCMVCHGELYRRRPDPSHLTEFYLLLAAGGALGGCFVAVVAPLVFADYYEFHWGLWLSALLFVVACAGDTKAPEVSAQPNFGTPDSASALLRGEGRGEGSVSRPTVPARAGKTSTLAKDLPDAQKQWRWLGCILPLFGFLLLDRFFANFGQEIGEARNETFTVLRWVLWGLIVFLVISWIAGGQFKRFSSWRLLVLGCLSVGVLGLGTTLWLQALKSGGGVVSISRNFYGVLTVYERDAQEPKQHHFVLRHGRTTHGMQFVDPEQARWPTAYYGETSGIGRTMRALPPQPARIGVVGLGAGTLATYCRPGDHIRIYEINPEVERLALSRFTYLTNCPAKVELVSGDARLSLEQEPAHEFDLLVLDAFSSDAIPVHLLTREAFEVYGRHLRTNGVVAIHISNYYLNLEPLVREIARRYQFRLALVTDAAPEAAWVFPSTWALMAPGPCFLDSKGILPQTAQGMDASTVRPWTDDFASLFPLLRWKPEPGAR